MWLATTLVAVQNKAIPPAAGRSLQPGKAAHRQEPCCCLPFLLLGAQLPPLLPHTLRFPTAFNQTPVEKGTQCFTAAPHWGAQDGDRPGCNAGVHRIEKIRQNRAAAHFG